MPFSFFRKRKNAEEPKQPATTWIAPLDPNPTPDQIEIACAQYLILGIGHCDAGDFNSALAALDQALALDPNNVNGHYSRGLVYQRKNDPEQAIKAYTHAISLNPTHMPSRLNRGILYQEQQQIDQAIADYTVCAEHGRTPEERATGYYHRANIRSAQSDLQSAIADYEQAIKLNPRYAQAWGNLGGVHFKQGNARTAFEAFTLAITLTPDDPINYFNRASLYAKIGNLDAMRTDLEQVIRLAPNTSLSQRAQFILSQI